MPQNSSKQNAYWLAFFSGVTGALFVLLVTALIVIWRNPGFVSALLSDAYLIVSAAEAVNATNKAALEELIRVGAVVEPERFYHVSVKFYETVIVILLSLLGLLGFFSAYYSRAISKARAEEVAEAGGREAIEKYIKDRRFQTDFDEKIEQVIEASFAGRLKEIEITLEDYGATKALVDQIQEHVGLQDVEEQDDADDEVQQE